MLDQLIVVLGNSISETHFISQIAISENHNSQFNPPSIDPYSTNFGQITSHSSTINRFLVIQGRSPF